MFSLTLICTQLAAQDSATGAIRGIVFDATGARILQATVVVVNAATGMRYASTSDAKGRFVLELLPPGDYSARVEAQGMSPDSDGKRSQCGRIFRSSRATLLMTASHS